MPEIRSASLCTGALPACASVTSRAICASAVSAPTLSARTTRRPPALIVAPKTSSPGCTSTGTLSRVRSDLSTAELPVSTTPSVTIFSPGRTRNRSPTWSSSIGTRRSRSSGSSTLTSLAPSSSSARSGSGPPLRAHLEVAMGFDLVLSRAESAEHLLAMIEPLQFDYWQWLSDRPVLPRGGRDRDDDGHADLGRHPRRVGLVRPPGRLAQPQARDRDDGTASRPRAQPGSRAAATKRRDRVELAGRLGLGTREDEGGHDRSDLEIRCRGRGLSRDARPAGISSVFRRFSIRIAQEAQVMPLIGSSRRSGLVLLIAPPPR